MIKNAVVGVLADDPWKYAMAIYGARGTGTVKPNRPLQKLKVNREYIFYKNEGSGQDRKSVVEGSSITTLGARNTWKIYGAEELAPLDFTSEPSAGMPTAVKK